ncbi:hypothetical protein KQX54_014433 [Cotesia glomerata]|uniref:Uncharacterized protein n=1 Tax=Cotesia glomerata TaxID=32391 RepID=A0AAV7ILX0_COTGL|nr:hypothetical protein KQX54_014433 [Cotesia glomerata]
MEITVLDFTGFQLGDILIIKEFGVAHLLDNSIHVEDPMVISTNSSTIILELLSDSRNFRDFYEKCRMRFGGPASHTAADLASKVQSLLRGNVYVRDASHADFLTRKTNLAVINFEMSEFGINEVRVCCFDPRGIVVNNKAIAPVTVYDSSNVTDSYKRSYQAVRGVAWNEHDLKIAGIKSILNNILREYSIEFVFVKSSGHKDFIHAVIGSSFRVVVLDDYDYAERADESCEERVRNMVRWVLQQKLYEG